MQKKSIDGHKGEGSFEVNKATDAMSIRHLKDTVEYNLRHAEEHLKAAKTACEKLHEHGETAPIPRSLVDLGEYFERTGGYEESVDKDATLKSKIKRMYK